MSRRYYSSQPIEGGEVTLDESEAHHLIHVMRAQVGDEVILFDGGGCEFTAVVAAMERRTVRLEINERREVNREARCHLTLGVALPKGDRQKVLCEKLVELGAACLVPLVTKRGVAQPNPSALKRLRKSVVEASKQCGRNRLMEVHEPMQYADFLALEDGAADRLIAHPSGTSALAVSAGERVLVSIGPEGGFTDEEVSAGLASGWDIASLGKRILRIETAAIVAAVKLIGE